MNTSAAELVRLESVSHSYGTGDSHHKALRNVSLSIPSGQTCAIVGSSGSGKSTLLNLIGLLDTPTTGHLFLNGKNMSLCRAEALAIARNHTIGFIFQSFNLLPGLSVLDNVALPLLYRGEKRHHAQEIARYYVGCVGLGDRIKHLPADLSGGQRQRVAIARALVAQPALLLADEPTGNLDSQNVASIIELLMTLNDDFGTTLIVVTHDTSIARKMSRCINVCDGKINEVLND